MLTNSLNCGTVCVCVHLWEHVHMCGYTCVCRYVLVEPEDNLRCYSLDAIHIFLKIKNHVKYVHVFHIFHVPATGG